MRRSDGAGNGDKRAGMRRDLRAAAVGGLAATFVVAASLAPKLLSGPAEVRVETSSSESALVEATTTSMAAPDTTTTEAQTSTTTAAPTTTTTAPPTTTTTTAPPTTTTTTAPAAPPRYVNCGGSGVPQSGLATMGCVVNPILAWNETFKPVDPALFPNFRVRVRFVTDNGPVEVVGPAPVNCGTFMVTIAAAGSPRYDTIVALEWDGGSMENRVPPGG